MLVDIYIHVYRSTSICALLMYKVYNMYKVQLSATRTKPKYVITIQLYLKTPSKTWQD